MCEVSTIFTNRELSILIWGTIYLVFTLRKSSCRKSIKNVIIALWTAKRAVLFFMLTPVSIGVLLLKFIIPFDIEIWKSIVVWIITYVFTNMFLRLLKIKSNNDLYGFFRQIVLSNAIVWYLIDFSSFSLFWEIIIIPISFFIGKLYFFKELKEDRNKDVRKLVMLLYYGIYIIWGYSLYLTLVNSSFYSWDTVNSFIVIPFLTVIYAVLVFPMVLIMNYESIFKAINLILSGQDKKVYKKKIWEFCKLNLSKINHCALYIFHRTNQSPDTLKSTIDTALKSYKKQSNKYEIQNN